MVAKIVTYLRCFFLGERNSLEICYSTSYYSRQYVI